MSWQLDVLNALLRRVARPMMGRVRAPKDARQDFERLMRRNMHVPPFLCHIKGPDGLNRITCGQVARRRIVLYFHGGGYISGSPVTHAGLLGRLSGLAGVEVAAAVYALAPEHPFPAAFEDARRAWSALMALGYRPRDVVVGGDSAGGGLALALLGHLCRAGTPPAAAFALSPWCDLALTGESLQRNVETEVVFPARRIGELVDAILPAGTDPRDPRISPLYGAFPNCPPVLLQYSKVEILQDDSARMAEVLRAAGGDVQTFAHPKAPHVWHLFDGWIPEARLSIESIAAFIKTHV